MNFTYRPTPISVKTALMAVAFGLLVGAVLIFAPAIAAMARNWAGRATNVSPT